MQREELLGGLNLGNRGKGRGWECLSEGRGEVADELDGATGEREVGFERRNGGERERIGRGRGGGEEVVFEREEGEEVLLFLDHVVESAIADPWNGSIHGAAAGARGREGTGREATAEGFHRRRKERNRMEWRGVLQGF